MWHKVNLFAAWFFIPLTLSMGWVAAVGRVVLELFGATTHEGDIPGRIVGALLLFGAVYLVQYLRGSLPPEGKPGGNGFRFGQRLVLARQRDQPRRRGVMALRQTSTNMMPPMTAIRPPRPIMPMPIFCGSVVSACSAPATLRCTP